MVEPSENVSLRNHCNGFRQSVVKFSLGPSLEATQGLFDLCNTFLNGIEVGGVGGQIQDFCPSRFNQGDGSW